MKTRNAMTKSEPNRGRGSRVAVAATVTLSSALGALAQSDAVAAEGRRATDSPSASTREWAASIRWENDTFGGTDQFYTDGFGLAGSHTGPSWIDPFANWLPWGEGRRTVGYDVAHGMFTPEDKDLSPPDPDDRPYAGILAFGLTLHVEKESAYHGLKFITGVLGPASLAEETQDAVHNLIGSETSEGWDYKLENDPIFNEARHDLDQLLLLTQRPTQNRKGLNVILEEPHDEHTPS